MTLVIRQATALDYGAVSLLYRQVDDLHSASLPQAFRATEGPSRGLTYVESLLEDEAACILLAERAGKVVGLINVSLRESPPLSFLVPRRMGSVDDLVVDGAARRSGVGRALMAEAETWARERGASAMELNVYDFNADAIDFYQELGYRTLSRRLHKRLM